MPITRKHKAELVDDLATDLKEAQAIIITDYRGLPVGELQGLRRDLRGMNASYHIAKNTLVRLALKDAGLPVPDPLLEGPTALAFLNEDLSGPAKKLGDFFKEKGLPIKGAIIGQQVYDAKGVESLATMPSKPQLFASILGSINAPASKTAGVISSGIRQVLYVLKARADQLEKQSGAA